jgi:SnoaL-like protein
MADDDALARLLDIEEIKQLKARYFRCLDTKDWQGFGDVFTADAVMDADGFVQHGREEILAFLPPILEGVVTTHHGHMPEITITGPDTATGIWAMFDYLTWPGDGPPKGLQGFGHYREEYVRERVGWRIGHLVLTRLRIDPLAGGLPG